MLIVETGDVIEGANSYVSVQEADDYITTNYPGEGDWSVLTIEERESALIRSTRFLDGLVSWRSAIKDNYQPLAWPRQDFQDREGRAVSSETVPTIVKEAQIELALSVAQGNDLTTEYERLEREDFGDTSDIYASPVSRGGNPIVRTLVKSLSFAGYARSRSSVVSIWRA